MWTIEDVAAFLGYSVRLVEEIVKDPLVPQPRIVSRGGDRRWSPSHWRRWMDDNDTNFLAGPVGGKAGEAHEMAVI